MHKKLINYGNRREYSVKNYYEAWSVIINQEIEFEKASDASTR